MKQTGVGCHINGNFIGVFSYADDITLICPSIWGLKKGLKFAILYKKNNSILFNKKKTTGIKIGDLIKYGGKAFLDGSDLVWKDNVRHLGNFVDSTYNDNFDCNANKSLFIAYFNKMMANYSCLQPTVLNNLFKSYCCSFYGSPLWKFNSTGFEKCCKAWNIAVRKFLHLQFKTHTWILGSLIGQRHISTQLQFCNFCFLLDALNSNNHIVKYCMRAALFNSNTCIGNKLAFIVTNLIWICIIIALLGGN